eukprot:624365-Amphidinium_carterae.1
MGHMLAGRFLTPARRYKRPDERQLALCTLCQQPDTEIHRYWYCPRWQLSRQKVVHLLPNLTQSELCCG